MKGSNTSFSSRPIKYIFRLPLTGRIRINCKDTHIHRKNDLAKQKQLKT